MSKQTDTPAVTADDPKLREAAMDAFDVGAANPDAPYTPPNQVPSSDVDGGEPDEIEGDDDGTDEGAGEGDPAAAGAGKQGEPGKGGKPAAKPDGKDPAADAAAAGKDGDGKPAKGEPAKDLTPEQQAAADKAEDDKAIKELGIKGKAEERFRTMSTTIREQSRVLEAVGGKDGLERLQRDAAAQGEWDQQLDLIGASPQQFGDAMGVIFAINKGTPEAKQQALDFILGEAKLLASALGVEIPGLVDPLDQHQDLKDKVASGALDRADALELAKGRTTVKAVETDRTTRQNADAAAQAEATGLRTLATLGATLKATDGAVVFAAKMDAIAPALELMQRTLTPDKWEAEAKRLYERAKYVAPAVNPPPKPRVGAVPARAGVAAAAGQVVRTPTDAMDAFDMGVEDERARGR